MVGEDNSEEGEHLRSLPNPRTRVQSNTRQTLVFCRTLPNIMVKPLPNTPNAPNAAERAFSVRSDADCANTTEGTLPTRRTQRRTRQTQHRTRVQPNTHSAEHTFSRTHVQPNTRRTRVQPPLGRAPSRPSGTRPPARSTRRMPRTPACARSWRPRRPPSSRNTKRATSVNVPLPSLRIIFGCFCKSGVRVCSNTKHA